MSTSSGGSGGRGARGGSGSGSVGGRRSSRLSTQRTRTLDERIRRSNSGAGWRNAGRNYGIST